VLGPEYEGVPRDHRIQDFTLPAAGAA
jgi:hypothetical protein